MTTLKRYHYPWETPRSLPKRFSNMLRILTGRNARFRIGTNILEVQPWEIWGFFDNGEYYERNFAYWLEKLLSGTKNKVFYDVGANIGYYCLRFADKASHIYAFEPVSRTYDMLAKNVRRNNLSNITVYKLGLSDQKSSRQIHLYSTNHKSSLFLRTANLNKSVEHYIGQEVIDLVTLDELIDDERLSPPDLMKIDIEGSELYALKGARKTIQKYQPILFIEFIEGQFEDAGYSRSDVLTELMTDNYAAYGIPKDVTDVNVYPAAEFDNIEVEDIIALPKGREYLIDDTTH